MVFGRLGRFGAGCPMCGDRRKLVIGGLAATGAMLAGCGSGQEAAPPAPAKGDAAAVTLPGLIDIHHHAIPDFWFQEAEPAIAAQVGDRIGPQWRGWTPEKSLAAMDEQGVAVALLSISAPGTWFGDNAKARSLTSRSNDALAEIAHARPDRFGFHGTLALPDVDGTLAEIDRALDDLKADGIGLMTSYGGKYLGDATFTPVLEKLNARKAVVWVHPVAPACCTTLMPNISPNFVEFLHDTNRTILSLILNGRLRAYPDITWIFSHAGGSLPMMSQRVDGIVAREAEVSERVPDGFMAEFNKLWFDVANSTNPVSLGTLEKIHPMNQVVFGTDYPIIPIGATVGGLKQMGFSAEVLSGIAQGNALRIYPQLAARLKQG